jgi:hypothetical protein
MAREVFDADATDGDGDGMVQDGTKYERPVGTNPEGYNPDATDGDGDGMVQDGTEFERPVEEKVEEPAAEESIIVAEEPIAAPAPAPQNEEGVFISASANKEPKAPKTAKTETEKVAIFSEKNLYREDVGKILRGYNIVTADAAEKWLANSAVRKATKEEMKNL